MKTKLNCCHSIFDRAIALEALSFAWSATAQSQTGSSASLNAKDKMFVKKGGHGRNDGSRHGEIGQ